MFDFFTKRQAELVQASPDVTDGDSLRERSDARSKAMEQAEALGSDEAAALSFILGCEFPEVRLHAAQRLQSAAAWEQVLQAMRNVDRRLTKLAQAHLQALSAKTEVERRARSCISQALTLQQSALLLPNQIVQLDHQWAQVEGASEDVIAEFHAIREQLAARLQHQAELQRALLDAVTHLKDLRTHLDILDFDATRQTFETLATATQQRLADPEAGSLPRQLILDVDLAFSEMKTLLELAAGARASVQRRMDMLAQWQKADRKTLNREQLTQDWRDLGVLGNDDASRQMQQDFDALLASLNPQKDLVGKGEPRRKSQAPDADLVAVWRGHLDELSGALEAGTLHAAQEADKALKALDAAGKRGTHAQHVNWTRLHGELQHLQGWARWGSKISREELVKSATVLINDKLAPTDLAKRVATLREQWKSLDSVSGPAHRELWNQFDQACTAAYAPAAAHFKKLSEERQHNGDKAAALLKEMQSRRDALTAETDWKSLAGYCTRVEQTWKSLGNMDRKQRKKLDKEFESLLSALRAPLADKQQHGVSRRVALIDGVSALNPADRHSLEQLQRLQQQWQEEARQLPLDRKDEQALWTRFRAACDQFFVRKKEQSHQADALRKTHLKDKENLCQHLESLDAGIAADEAAKALREARDAWRKIGAVPRAVEEKLETRFRNACHRIQSMVSESKRRAEESESQSLLTDLRRCLDAERRFLAGDAFDADLTPVQSQGKAGSPEKLLLQRWHAVHAAWQSGRKEYAQQLGANLTRLEEDLLQAEIQLGLDSPPELARQRMQAQVALLKVSMKAGKHIDRAAMLAHLISLAAVPSERDQGRLHRLIGLLRRSV